MQPIYIYDHFNLAAIVRNYTSLKWVRRYNRSGEFTLQLPNTPENVALAQDGFIVAKDGDDEAGFIEDVVMGDSIEIRGAFISKMLAFRVVNFASDYPVPLQATANNLIATNFINTSPERIVPGLRIKVYPFVKQKIKNRSGLLPNSSRTSPSWCPGRRMPA